MRSDELEIRFYLDAATGVPHIYKHGVDEDEVIEILEKPGEDRPGREGSRVALVERAQADTCGSFTYRTRCRTACL
jgi:hypothetical protein